MDPSLPYARPMSSPGRWHAVAIPQGKVSIPLASLGTDISLAHHRMTSNICHRSTRIMGSNQPIMSLPLAIHQSDPLGQLPLCLLLLTLLIEHSPRQCFQ